MCIRDSLMAYAKPYALRFVFVGIVMLFTIAFDIVSPLIIGGIADMIVTDFKLNKLFIMVGMLSLIHIYHRYIRKNGKHERCEALSRKIEGID